MKIVLLTLASEVERVNHQRNNTSKKSFLISYFSKDDHRCNFAVTELWSHVGTAVVVDIVRPTYSTTLRILPRIKE